MKYKMNVIWAVLLLWLPGLAGAEVYATLTSTSDNVSRGISDTAGDPAIQGAFDYSHDSGIYAGLWASNVKFRENADVPADETDLSEAECGGDMCDSRVVFTVSITM